MHYKDKVKKILNRHGIQNEDIKEVGEELRIPEDLINQDCQNEIDQQKGICIDHASFQDDEYIIKPLTRSDKLEDL